MSAQHQLFERMINAEKRPGNDVLVIHIERDSNDAVRGWAEARDKLYYRVGPREVAVDGILIREHAPRNTLPDDHDGFRTLAIGIVEITSGDNRNAESSEDSGRDGPKLGALIFVTM